MKKLPQCDDLPPAERAACYRQQAEEIQFRATRAVNEDLKAAYLLVAEDWLKLADDIEAQYGQVTLVIEPELASLLAKAS
jgi:hypothetical protein